MKRIILSGGGTLGSVSPLIAIYEELKSKLPEAEFLWVGTKNGPEKKIAESYKIPYHPISSGKLRRYFSFQNFFDVFSIALGFFECIFLLLRFKPSLVLTAGGFVAVPLSWASYLMRIPVTIHQQDARVGLANRLMAPFASLITGTFEIHEGQFGKKKVIITGNPLRRGFMAVDRVKAIDFFGFTQDEPVILVLGGGTGAKKINEFIFQSIGGLTQFCQVIHSAGEGKLENKILHSKYRAYEFLFNESLSRAYACADLVVTRGGMSTLTELANLGKPIIIIPIPASHQIDNAYEFENKNAALVLNQNDLTSEKFVKIIHETLLDKKLLQALSENIGKMFPKDATEEVVNEVLRILSVKNKT